MSQNFASEQVPKNNADGNFYGIMLMKYAGEFRFLNNKSVCRNHEASHTGGGGLPRGDPKDKVIIR